MPEENVFTPANILLVLRETFCYKDRSLLEKVWISTDCAKLVQLADPEEKSFIVEWDTVMSYKPTEAEHHEIVCCWQAHEYRNSYKQYLIKKELSDKEREQSHETREQRERLRKKIANKFFFGSGTESAATRESIDKMVTLLINARSEEAEKFFGINLDELRKADETLAEFKKQNKIK